MMFNVNQLKIFNNVTQKIDAVFTIIIIIHYKVQDLTIVEI